MWQPLFCASGAIAESKIDKLPNLMAHFSLYVYRDGTGDRKINKQKNNGVIIGAMIQKYTVCIMRKG